MIKYYKNMLQQYQASLELLQKRIAELTSNIREGHADSENILMSERRYRLYQEMWEIQGDMRQISEYIQSVSGRLTECVI